MRTFTDKPLVITETGATDVSGLMPRWITQMFQELRAHPDVIGIIWFEAFNVIDWKVSDDRTGQAPRSRPVWPAPRTGSGGSRA